MNIYEVRRPDVTQKLLHNDIKLLTGWGNKTLNFGPFFNGLLLNCQVRLQINVVLRWTNIVFFLSESSYCDNITM